MELITILNRCHRFRGFVYQHAHFSADKKSIEVAVRPRKGRLQSGRSGDYPRANRPIQLAEAAALSSSMANRASNSLYSRPSRAGVRESRDFKKILDRARKYPR